MNCSTCKHYYRPIGDRGGRDYAPPHGACMNLAVTNKLLVEPEKCDKYEADMVLVEREHKAAAQPVRQGPERWLSEQTLLKLRPRTERDWHGADR